MALFCGFLPQFRRFELAVRSNMVDGLAKADNRGRAVVRMQLHHLRPIQTRRHRPIRHGPQETQMPSGSSRALSLESVGPAEARILLETACSGSVAAARYTRVAAPSSDQWHRRASFHTLHHGK